MPAWSFQCTSVLPHDSHIKLLQASRTNHLKGVGFAGSGWSRRWRWERGHVPAHEGLPTSSGLFTWFVCLVFFVQNLTIWPRLALKLWSFCICPSSATITCMGHHIPVRVFFFLKNCLFACVCVCICKWAQARRGLLFLSSSVSLPISLKQGLSLNPRLVFPRLAESQLASATPSLLLLELVLKAFTKSRCGC